jgi:hypothetical protein
MKKMDRKENAFGPYFTADRVKVSLIFYSAPLQWATLQNEEYLQV